MRFQGAHLKEQGVEFAIAIVKRHVVDSPGESRKAQAAFAAVFPRVPIVLMAQDGRGTPKYRGRPDIVRFLAKVDPGRIPWKEFTVRWAA